MILKEVQPFLFGRSCTAQQGTTAACTTTATPSTSTASTASAPLNTTASLTSAAPLTSEKRRAGTEPASCQSHSTERVLREILTFPTLDASGPPNVKMSKEVFQIL